MLPKRTEAELDAFVEMTRNEAKPSPALLSAEMLGEEDRANITNARTHAEMWVTQLRTRAVVRELSETEQADLDRDLRLIAWADRLLQQGEG